MGGNVCQSDYRRLTLGATAITSTCSHRGNATDDCKKYYAGRDVRQIVHNDGDYDDNRHKTKRKDKERSNEVPLERLVHLSVGAGFTISAN